MNSKQLERALEIKKSLDQIIDEVIENKNKMKKIKKVTKHGAEFKYVESADMWRCTTPSKWGYREWGYREWGYREWVTEDVIRNCPLFEVEYESEPKIWRAEYGEGYVCIGAVFETRKASEDYHDVDDDRYELGNYFHPQDDAKEIEQVRKEIAEVYARSKARRAR